MQGGVIQQRHELSRMGHGQELQVEALGRPAALKVHHPPTITAGQRLTGRPGRRQMSKLSAMRIQLNLHLL